MGVADNPADGLHLLFFLQRVRRHGCLPFGELEYIALRSKHASKTMRQRGNVEVATDQHDPFWTVLLALDVLLTVRRNDGHHRSFQPTS